jgi:hypothetical protein
VAPNMITRNIRVMNTSVINPEVSEYPPGA